MGSHNEYKQNVQPGSAYSVSLELGETMKGLYPRVSATEVVMRLREFDLEGQKDRCGYAFRLLGDLATEALRLAGVVHWVAVQYKAVSGGRWLDGEALLLTRDEDKQ